MIKRSFESVPKNYLFFAKSGTFSSIRVVEFGGKIDVKPFPLGSTVDD